jgi:hypothetical protein
MTTAAFVADTILTATALNSAINSKADLSAGGKLSLGQAPYSAGLNVTIDGAGVINASAPTLLGVLGCTPPLAAQFTFWYRQNEVPGQIGVNYAGPSTITDTPQGALFSIQTTQNTYWAMRFAGMPSPPAVPLNAPHELICAFRPADMRYSPYLMHGPCYFRAANTAGCWLDYDYLGNGNGVPTSAATANMLAVQFPTTLGAGSNTTWTDQAAYGATPFYTLSLDIVYFRFVFDASGYLTGYVSNVGITGPWEPLYSGKMDSLLGSPGTGCTPDYIGAAFSGVDLGGPVATNHHSLCIHWDLHTYAGPAQPGWPPSA